MMLSTHILAGGSFGLFLSIFAPQAQLSLIITGMLAGFVPDLDMFLEHRKTLHRPIQFSLSVILFGAIYLATGSELFLASFVFFGSLTLHTLFDILANGKTMNPDIKQDDRSVYNHLEGDWIGPVRLVKEGSSKDFFVGFILSLPLAMVQNNLVTYLALLLLLVGLIQNLLTDWVTNSLLSDYDRFSEAIQKKIGYGPETQE